MKLSKIVNEILLVERVLTLITPDDRKKYLDVVWDILQKSYEKIGGFKSVPNKEALIPETNIWKLVRKGNKIVAVGLYSSKSGRKCIGSGTDGSPEGKAALLQMWLDDTKQNRSWGEVSGAAEHIKLKQGHKVIPNKYASQILNKDILSLNPDGVHYTRMIGGEPHEKLLTGHVEGLNLE